MRKLDQLVRFLKPGPDDSILEVGIATREYSAVDNFLIKNYPYRSKITALGLGDCSEFRNTYPDVPFVGYDGTRFPFHDGHFDIAHANAVIEHVGPLKAQELFLKEIARVCQRGMITTPNRNFPVETHTRVPLLHWMGKERFDRFLRLIGKDWATGDYMHLLTDKGLRLLAGKAGLKNYVIVRNRALGMSLTFSLIWIQGDKERAQFRPAKGLVQWKRQ
jgi:hypothetical protein